MGVTPGLPRGGRNPDGVAVRFLHSVAAGEGQGMRELYRCLDGDATAPASVGFAVTLCGVGQLSAPVSRPSGSRVPTEGMCVAR